jgi:hypothetical protein
MALSSLPSLPSVFPPFLPRLSVCLTVSLSRICTTQAEEARHQREHDGLAFYGAEKKVCLKRRIALSSSFLFCSLLFSPLLSSLISSPPLLSYLLVSPLISSPIRFSPLLLSSLLLSYLLSSPLLNFAKHMLLLTFLLFLTFPSFLSSYSIIDFDLIFFSLFRRGDEDEEEEDDDGVTKGQVRSDIT